MTEAQVNISRIDTEHMFVPIVKAGMARSGAALQGKARFGQARQGRAGSARHVRAWWVEVGRGPVGQAS